MDTNQRRKLREATQRVAATVVVVLPLLFIVLWLTFQHKPSWYVPSELDDEGQRRARREAVNFTDTVSDLMAAGEPFEIAIRERSVNEWLTLLPEWAPEAVKAIPPEVADPAVGFQRDHLRIGARYTAGAWRAIVSLCVRLTVTENGAALEAALAGAHGGSLPLPRAILRRAVDPVLAVLDEKHGHKRGAGDAGAWPFDGAPTLDQLYRGIRVRNRFVWFNGQRPFRFRSIRLEEGILRLEIEPL